MTGKQEPLRSTGEGAWRSRQPRRRSGLPLALAILSVIALFVLGAVAVDALR